MKKPHILIAGGTGLIGSHLSRLLLHHGYQVTLLSRQLRSLTGLDVIRWNPDNLTVDPIPIEGELAIVNLAGENLSSARWDESRKKQIIESRTNSLKLIKQIVRDRGNQVTRVVSASAIGYYGTFNSEQVLDEASQPGSDFLAQTCLEWENAILDIMQTGVPTAWIRTGVVLSREGGALQAILGSTRTGFAIPLGSGNQWIPWIHVDDIIRMFQFLLENPELKGAYNGVAPVESRNRDLMKAIARVHKKIYLPVGIPAFLIRWILGEMAVISLYGSRISPQKILDAGFSFQHIFLEDAVRSFTYTKRAGK